ncbi:MAG: shikimate kinase [Kiritimatiellaeota bacterium]|nr:shikimate kinase [Kiritimatiellota bacterium]
MGTIGTGIVLIGFPSCGKSTVGRDLARRLGRAFVDSDQALAALFARRLGRTLSVREIFRNVGESEFRRLETEALKELARDHAGAVVATGGGAPLQAENVPVLAALGRIVYLFAPLETCLRRMDAGKGRPVFLRDRATAERLWAERDAAYARVADIWVDAGAHTVVEIVEAILRSAIRGERPTNGGGSPGLARR